MFQDLEKIQRYKGQQSNWEPLLLVGIRLFGTETHKALTKEAGDQAVRRSGDTQHVSKEKGMVWIHQALFLGGRLPTSKQASQHLGFKVHWGAEAAFQ